MTLKVLFVLIIIVSALKLTEGYLRVDDDSYWRNYRGRIPKDALPGGLTSEGEVTFIGEAVHESSLWYGDLRSSGNIYYYLYGELVSETEHLKVLCTNNPERFVWKHIRNVQDLNQTNKDSLISGLFSMGKCYVGRARYDRSTIVGTACYDEHGLNYIFNGATDNDVFESKTFELLVYNPMSVMRGTAIRNNCCTLLLLFVLTIVTTRIW